MPRILVVDDEKIPRVTVASTLEQASHEVTTAATGKDGIARARDWQPDVVILDVHMPEMDGFDVVAELKRDESTAAIPVIFLTATAPTDELVVRGLELGAYDFLNKGCSRGELLARVGVMSRIKRGHDELAAIARVSDTLIRTADPGPMMATLIEQTRAVFRANVALLLMEATGDDEDDEIRAAAGIDPEHEDAEPLARAIEAWLDAHETTSDVMPVAELGDVGARMTEQHGLRTAAAALVQRGDVRPLMLAVLTERESGFRRDSDAALLHALARQASIAIQNALLQARTLAQARQLERAMTERSRFFASMSHELRTPINALLGYNQLLRDGFFGELNEKQTGAVEKLNRSAQHLLELINDVLDISKIEAGKIRIFSEDVDIAALLQDTLTSVELQAKEKGLALLVDGPDSVPAHTDAARLRQILLNLLSNAVKFTEKGSVEVHLVPMAKPPADLAARDGDWICISVKDTGAGIAPEDQERIFHEFEQVSGAAARGGTGLGLAISQRLALLLGGRMRLESEVGVGSRFTVEIPRVAPEEET